MVMAPSSLPASLPSRLHVDDELGVDAEAEVRLWCRANDDLVHPHAERVEHQVVSGADRVRLRSFRRAQDVTRREGPQWNSGDSTREASRSFTGLPSISAYTSDARFRRSFAHARSEASSSPWNGGGSNTEHSTERIGKNNRVPDWTVTGTVVVGNPAGTTGAVKNTIASSPSKAPPVTNGYCHPQLGWQRPPATTPPSIGRRSVLGT